ncbi:MAG: NUDIX hydrolase [Gemmobacter sp.]
MSRLRHDDLTGNATHAEQVGALCWRIRRGAIQVLLVTSRDTGRWVVPKGWPMPGRTPHAAAAREAWEEAGVEGAAMARCIGTYTYDKALDTGRVVCCAVSVFPVEVTALAKTWPEKHERRRRWMDLTAAARRVQEPELAALIAAFDPATLGSGDNAAA